MKIVSGTKPTTDPDSPAAPKDGSEAHHPDTPTMAQMAKVRERFDANQWVARSVYKNLLKSQALAFAALGGAIVRMWRLAEEIETRGDPESAEQIRDWCRHMRRVTPPDYPGLPAMPAPPERKVVAP